MFRGVSSPAAQTSGRDCCEETFRTLFYGTARRDSNENPRQARMIFFQLWLPPVKPPLPFHSNPSIGKAASGPLSTNRVT
jgi:hypothetical protein